MTCHAQWEVEGLAIPPEQSWDGVARYRADGMKKQRQILRVAQDDKL